MGAGGFYEHVHWTSLLIPFWKLVDDCVTGTLSGQFSS